MRKIAAYLIAMGGGNDQLPADIRSLLRDGSGVFRAADAAAAGVSAPRIRRLVRAKLLIELARGCYAEIARYAELNGWERHLDLARAYALSCDTTVLVTGWAAAYRWKLRMAGPIPRLPSVLRPGTTRGGGLNAYARVSGGAIPEDHMFKVGKRGRRWFGLVSREWAVGDVARMAPVPDALILADSAVQAGADLAVVPELFRSWRRAPRARWVSEHADGLSESALESLGRFTCLQFDLPVPISNAWVGEVRPEFRVDHLWPYHWAVGEADGAVKYRGRDDIADVVHAQSNREFRLRRLDLDIVRYGWDEAERDRRRLAAKFTALLRDNPRRPEPVRWWKHVPGDDPVAPGPGDWPSPMPLRVRLPAAWDVEHDPLRQPLQYLDE